MLLFGLLPSITCGFFLFSFFLEAKRLFDGFLAVNSLLAEGIFPLHANRFQTGLLAFLEASIEVGVVESEKDGTEKRDEEVDFLHDRGFGGVEVEED